MTHDEILADLVSMIADVVGSDFLLDVDVAEDTTFNADLALESIEFVALAEKLQERYDGQVDFVAFVADLDIDEIMSMTVGRLVGYIAQCLNESGLAAPGLHEPGLHEPGLHEPGLDAPGVVDSGRPGRERATAAQLPAAT